jgi:hypothetical protein
VRPLAYQEALARTVTDARLRDEVLHGGEPDGLSAPQRAWLRELDPRRLETFSQLVRLNRLGKIAQSLPLTTALLGEDLWGVVCEFCQAAPPQAAKKYEEGLAFARYLEARLADDDGLLADAVRYERATLEVRFDERPAEFGSPHAVLAVNHDFDVVAERLAQGGPFTGVPRREMLLLVHRLETGALGQSEISPAVAALLFAAEEEPDAERVIDRVAARLGADPEDPGFRAGCRAAHEQLAEQGLLPLRREA